MRYRAISAPIARYPEGRAGRTGIARQRGANRACGGASPLSEPGPSRIDSTSPRNTPSAFPLSQVGRAILLDRTSNESGS
jgi:hypothetical protein